MVKQILRTLKADPQLAETLGLAIRPQPEWWLNGYPIIHGQVRGIISSVAKDGLPEDFQINQLQGNIDLSFRIKGSLGAFINCSSMRELRDSRHSGSGTVYFTSVRKAKGIPYEICMFLDPFESN